MSGFPTNHADSRDNLYTGPITRSRARFHMNGNPGIEGTGGRFSRPEFQRELKSLKEQNVQLRRGKRGNIHADSTHNLSKESISSATANMSVRSFPGCSVPSSAAPGPSIFRPSSATAGVNDFNGESSYAHPLSSLSLLPRPRQMSLLETLVRAFPVNVPTVEVGCGFESPESPALTPEMKRYLSSMNNQHNNEFEKHVNVFQAERPWEPKWFTNFLTRLIVTTKARPNIYQFMFDARLKPQESRILQTWKDLSGIFRWLIGLAAMMTFLTALCFFIDSYGEEGVNFAVPLTLLVNIFVNKVLTSLNSALPDDV